MVKLTWSQSRRENVLVTNVLPLRTTTGSSRRWSWRLWWRSCSATSSTRTRCSRWSARPTWTTTARSASTSSGGSCARCSEVQARECPPKRAKSCQRGPGPSDWILIAALKGRSQSSGPILESLVLWFRDIKVPLWYPRFQFEGSSRVNNFLPGWTTLSLGADYRTPFAGGALNHI